MVIVALDCGLKPTLHAPEKIKMESENDTPTGGIFPAEGVTFTLSEVCNETFPTLTTLIPFNPIE